MVSASAFASLKKEATSSASCAWRRSSLQFPHSSSRSANGSIAFPTSVTVPTRASGGSTVSKAAPCSASSRNTPRVLVSSQVLAAAEQHTIDVDTNAALCIIRQLVPAVAVLHQHARDVAHGALAPERILVTPDTRIVVTDYVLGSAIDQLRLSRDRLWRDLRIAIPPGAGSPRLDQRGDVMQMGVVALALLVGRPLQRDELGP